MCVYIYIEFISEVLLAEIVSISRQSLCVCFRTRGCNTWHSSEIQNDIILLLHILLQSVFLNHTPVWQKICYRRLLNNLTFLVNWLKEIKLKGQLGSKKTNFRFKEGDKMTQPTPFEEVLEPFVRVIKWGLSWNEMVENKEVLLEMWSEAPRSITHKLWLSMDWEMQAVDVLGTWDDCVKLMDLRRRYSWYSSSVNMNLDSVVLAWETLTVLEGKLCKE